MLLDVPEVPGRFITVIFHGHGRHQVLFHQVDPNPPVAGLEEFNILCP